MVCIYLIHFLFYNNGFDSHLIDKIVENKLKKQTKTKVYTLGREKQSSFKSSSCGGSL